MANDGGHNYLYKSDGKGHFTDVAYQAGVALDENGRSPANMGVALGDYLHTGRFSIVISHFSDQYLELFRNDGNLNFTDVSSVARIKYPSIHDVGWGDAFYDLDNDGWLDLIVVNGHVYPQVEQASVGVHFREPSLLFLNQRDGTFRDAGDQGGAALKLQRVGRGLLPRDFAGFLAPPFCWATCWRRPARRSTGYSSGFRSRSASGRTSIVIRQTSCYR